MLLPLAATAIKQHEYSLGVIPVLVSRAEKLTTFGVGKTKLVPAIEGQRRFKLAPPNDVSLHAVDVFATGTLAAFLELVAFEVGPV
jgi:hypothetical protein